MNGLVETIDYKIGLDENKIIGLMRIKDNRTPTDNPQATGHKPLTIHKPTNVKIKRAHVANMKHSTRTQRKNKRGNTAQPHIDSTRINSD